MGSWWELHVQKSTFYRKFGEFQKKFVVPLGFAEPGWKTLPFSVKCQLKVIFIFKINLLENWVYLVNHHASLLFLHGKKF